MKSLNSKDLKIIVAGGVASGKTTAIKAISEVPVLGTEVKATEYEALRRKDTTTTAMEYGVAHINESKVHIYGIPGQRRFNFMADILCKKADGMIVMIDNGSDNPIEQVDYYLNLHGDFLKQHPAIIGITHFDDLCTRTSLLDYHRYIMDSGFKCPVIKLDAREKKQVETLFKHLLLRINQSNKDKTIYLNSAA